MATTVANLESIIPIAFSDCFRVEPLPMSRTPEGKNSTAVVMTVANPKIIHATAVFEYFPAQIAVVGAGFVEYDCHQAIAI